MNVTDPLREEHRVILAVLGEFESWLAGLRAGGREAAEGGVFLDFFEGFVDGRHHAKEEQVLFPTLERGGAVGFGPLLVMREEHDRGRDHVKTLRSLLAHVGRGNAVARRAVLDRGEEFVALLRAHIQKEDHCLFPMVEARLGPEEAREVVAAYAAKDRGAPLPGETGGDPLHLQRI